jgi:hypothetical protein
LQTKIDALGVYSAVVVFVGHAKGVTGHAMDATGGAVAGEAMLIIGAQAIRGDAEVIKVPGVAIC